jgi:hypothetical protein
MNNQIDETLLDELDNPTPESKEYHFWGQPALEVFEGCWMKGAKEPIRYDPQLHSWKKTYVQIVVYPLPETGSQYNTTITLTTGSDDYIKATMPSIKALGISPRDLPKYFVHGVRKPSGRTYKKGDEVKEIQDSLFLEIFQSQDECAAAYLQWKAGSPASPLSDNDFPALDPTPTTTTTTGPGNDILLKFARALVTSAAKDNKDLAAVTEKVRTQLDANPMMAGKYTADSPEILEMIIEACQ